MHQLDRRGVGAHGQRNRERTCMGLSTRIMEEMLLAKIMLADVLCVGNGLSIVRHTDG